MGRDRGQGGAEEKAIYGYRCALCICLLAVVASSLRTGLAATLPVLVLAAFVGAIEKVLADAYGALARWEELFRATGASLGGGSGWVVTAWDFHRDVPYTYASGNHSQAFAAGMPLLVMDMYEHAYQMDYGAAAAKYIDAFFANIQWDEVNRRLERARRAAAALRA